MAPTQISDYTILPLTIPATASYPHQTTHTLYLRPHAPKIPTADSSRSLFLVNVPIDSTHSHFRAIFTNLLGAGKFEDIVFENQRSSTSTSSTVAILEKNTAQNKIGNGKKRKRGQDEDVKVEVGLPETWDREVRGSGSTAVVVLVDERCVELAIKSILKLHKKAAKSKSKGSENVWPVWGEGLNTDVPNLGSARYATHHKLRFPDQKTLLANVDAFMSAFNAAEENANAERKRQRNVVDEDGFITVSRGGRVGPSRMEDAERKRAEQEEKEKKRVGEMGDFYRFQMREQRKKEAGELVREFEADKEKIRRLREGRGRFRPE